MAYELFLTRSEHTTTFYFLTTRVVHIMLISSDDLGFQLLTIKQAVDKNAFLCINSFIK